MHPRLPKPLVVLIVFWLIALGLGGSAFAEDMDTLISDGAVRLRSTPSVQGKVVGMLYKGSLVKAGPREGDWVQVHPYDGPRGAAQDALGYAYAKLLHVASPLEVETAKVLDDMAPTSPRTEPRDPAPAEDAGNQAKDGPVANGDKAAVQKLLISKGAVRLRSMPSLQGKVVGMLYKGNIVRAGSREGDWVQVFPHDGAHDGAPTALGYAHANLLRKAAPLDLETAKVLAALEPTPAKTEPAQPAVAGPVEVQPAKVDQPKDQAAESQTVDKPDVKAEEPEAETAAPPPPAEQASSTDDAKEQPAPAEKAQAEEQTKADKAEPAHEAEAAGEQPKPSQQAVMAKYAETGFTLDEAVDFALKYNLEAAAAEQEQAILVEARTSKMMSMLPSLIVDAERSWKDRDLPVASVNANTGEVSLAPSISSEKETSTQGVELSWDILNFAVGYVSYRQSELDLQAAQAHIQRVKQNLALDVTKAYMKAVAAKSVVGLAQDLKKQAEEKRGQLAQQMESRLLSDIEGLESDINLIKMLIKIQEYEKAYDQTIIELAHAMGWPDPAGLKLRQYAFEKSPGYIATPVEELERQALAARPELRKLDFQKQHAQREGERALYEAIPSLKVYGRYDRDDNKYMTEHEWFSFGLHLSWDLLAIPEKLYARRSAGAKESKVALEKRVMEVTIATQVRLAALEQSSMFQRYDLFRQLKESRMRLVETLEVMVEKGKTSQALLLDAANKYLNAHVQYVNTYSNIVISQARLRNALGKTM